jgi:hypothetical protein
MLKLIILALCVSLPIAKVTDDIEIIDDDIPVEPTK